MLRVFAVSLLVAVAAIFAFLAITGRGYYLLGTLAALSPFLGQIPRFFCWLKTLGGGGSAGGKSRVNTAWLAMALDHQTGAMEGEVRQGQYAGQQLSDMDQEDLMALLQEVAADDTQSAALVEAYLDRMFPDWRQQGAGAGPGAAGASGPGGGANAGGQRQSGGRRRAGAAGGMTPDQAYEILGLTPGADRDAIREAHRRLIRQVHPDAGGSDFLAAQINQAKEVLLGES